MKDWCNPLRGIHCGEWEMMNLDQCLVSCSELERMKLVLRQCAELLADVTDAYLLSGRWQEDPVYVQQRKTGTLWNSYQVGDRNKHCQSVIHLTSFKHTL